MAEQGHARYAGQSAASQKVPSESRRTDERQSVRPEPRSFTYWEPSALRRLEEDIENG